MPEPFAFAEHDALAEWLGITFNSAQQQRASFLLGVASQKIIDYVGQSIVAGEEPTTALVDGSGTPQLVLPEYPVTAIATVVDDGDELVENEGFRWSAAGILYRLGGCWTHKARGVQVTYSHGRAIEDIAKTSIPGIAVAMAARAWGNPEATASKQLANRQSTWRETYEGMQITESEQKLLDRYGG